MSEYKYYLGFIDADWIDIESRLEWIKFCMDNVVCYIIDGTVFMNNSETIDVDKTINDFMTGGCRIILKGGNYVKVESDDTFIVRLPKSCPLTAPVSLIELNEWFVSTLETTTP